MIKLLSLLFGLHVLDGESLERALRLWHRACELPDVRPELITPTITAALTAETPEFPAELLLAIAWGESRLDSTIKTGKACGPMQSIPSHASDCVRWCDPIEGFKAGVAELIEWSHDKRTRGDVRLVLLAMACGNSAFDGTCKKKRWPGWVLARAHRLGMHDVRPAS